MIRSIAALDNGLRDEFLADAAFAAKYDGGAGAGDGFDGLIDLLHGGAAADEAVEGGFAFELLEKAAPFEFEGAPGHVCLQTATLAERGGKTLVRTVSAFQSVEDRDAMVASGMERGVAASYDRLAELLASADTGRKQSGTANA